MKDNKPIVLVGQGNVGVGVAEALTNHKHEIEIIEIDDSFLIDGIEYVPIKKDKSNSVALKLINHYGIGFKEKQRPKINLIDEYKLVNKKVSKLNRNDRDWVVRLFHNRYEKKI